jgi:hypothetical protein
VVICTGRSKTSNRILPIRICAFPVIVVVNRCHHKPGLHRLTVPVSRNANDRNASGVVSGFLYDNKLVKASKFFALIMCA